MEDALTIARQTAEQNRKISEVIRREQTRLANFIRKRVADAGDAEDILQEVFYELVEAYRALQPIEQAGAWLYRVARNRIVDSFRKKRPQALEDRPAEGTDDESGLTLGELLPSPDDGPDAAYARSVLLEEIQSTIGELPEEQREVFLAHEIEGRSFKELAGETGVSINTLLSRKRYAVRYLRRRLQGIYDEYLNS
jgi:RNA polymerase sigma factor (sigma-70 family)